MARSAHRDFGIRALGGVLLTAGVLIAGGCSDGYVPPGSPSGDVGDSGVPGDGLEVDSGSRSDTGSMRRVDATAADGDTDPSQSCNLGADWQVARDEVTFKAGVEAKFRVASDVPVDTEGDKMAGTRRWDFSKSYTGDQTKIIEFQELTGKWFAPDYPEADYAMRLSSASDVLGVFRVTSEALELLGVVSPKDGYRKTNISYDPPVDILKFPLEPGSSWRSNTTASGTHKTWSPVTPITYQETYRNQVDAKGTVVTPHGSFRALRVRTVLERSGAATGVPLGTVRTFSFVTECFGTIATIRSERGESDTEFDRAAEIRRLTP